MSTEKRKFKLGDLVSTNCRCPDWGYGIVIAVLEKPHPALDYALKPQNTNHGYFVYFFKAPSWPRPLVWWDVDLERVY